MKRRIALIGCGYLGEIIAKAMEKGLLPGYEMAAAMSRRRESAEALCRRAGGAAAEGLAELLGAKPDFVIETASVETVREYCVPILEAGISFIPLSIGAFADRALYERARSAAERSGAKLYIPHGAVGGFDVLRTAALMAEAEGRTLRAGISTRKGPASLRNTPVYRPELETEEQLAFSGSCKEAIALLPAKVNVAVAQSLATVGPERASARITAVPGFVGDEHTITAELPGIRVVSQVYSENAAIAGWSIVSLLRDLHSPVSFF